jgi:hypothetical protein
MNRGYAAARIAMPSWPPEERWYANYIRLWRSRGSFVTRVEIGNVACAGCSSGIKSPSFGGIAGRFLSPTSRWPRFWKQ